MRNQVLTQNCQEGVCQAVLTGKPVKGDNGKPEGHKQV